MVLLVFASKEQTFQVLGFQEDEHMGQNASDWLQMEQTSLLVQTAVRLAAADYTDPSWWAGEFQEVENKGLGMSTEAHQSFRRKQMDNPQPHLLEAQN